MKTQRQFDGLNSGEALTEVLKEFSYGLFQDFEFDNDTQIATFDVRAMPVMEVETSGIESKASFDFNAAMEQVREVQLAMDKRVIDLDEREKELKGFSEAINKENKELDKLNKEIQNSIAELEKLKVGSWHRIKSFFHRQT